MANLQNYRYNQKPSFVDSLGQKAKNLADFGVAMKNVYDVGKVVYRGFQIAAPYIERAMLAGL